MKIALLSPVPCNVIASGLEKCAGSGRVAFGTDSRSTFVDPDLDPKEVQDSDLKIPVGLPVLIYPSVRASKANGLFKGPYAVVKRTFCGWVAANRRGLHPHGSAVRPDFTLAPETADTGWDGFWEVTDLELLEKPVSFGALRSFTHGTKFKLGFVPEHPMLIKWEDA